MKALADTIRDNALEIETLHNRIDSTFQVRFRGSEAFWAHIAELAMASGSTIGIKANWLIWSRQNCPVREWLGQELLRSKYQEAYVPDLGFRRQRGA